MFAAGLLVISSSIGKFL